MNSETLLQLLQNSFRITLGATASLIEVLQDPQKRDENLTKLQQEWGQLAEEWAVKGESTEQEARNFVNTLLNQRNAQNASAGYGASASPSTAVPAPAAEIQTELQDLTNQIASIRAELENLRNPNS
jgi:polyhydroxyalkanoate synthesis regulator phasin